MREEDENWPLFKDWIQIILVGLRFLLITSRCTVLIDQEDFYIGTGQAIFVNSNQVTAVRGKAKTVLLLSAADSQANEITIE